MLALLASRTVWMGVVQLLMSAGLFTKVGIDVSGDQADVLVEGIVGTVTAVTGIGTILFRKHAKGPL